MKLTNQLFPLAVMALSSIHQLTTAQAPPSAAPSTSLAPTFTIDVDRFDWDIERDGPAEIAFSDESDTEIRLRYNISIRDTLVRAFEIDCSTPVPETVAALKSKRSIKSPKHADLEVDIDFAQNNVTAYPGIWTDVDVGIGLIEMCVRVDLVFGGGGPPTSVTFHEQKLYINVGLLKGFEVTNIDLNRDAAGNETGAVDVDYNITACHCAANGTCINTVLSQGSDVYICIETSAENLEIADVRELTMDQGSGTVVTYPIVGGIEDPLTLTTIDGKTAQVRYQIISAFFTDPFPQEILVSGAVVLAFLDDNGRRLLRYNVFLHRELADEDLEKTPEEGFAVRLAVQAANPPESTTSGASTKGLVSILVALVAMVV
jgi:hypothetical protein